LEQIQAIIVEVIRLDHLFVSQPATPRWEYSAMEDVPWEIFRGRLLDPAHTRERRTFIAWNLFLDDGTASSNHGVLSIKLDPAMTRLYVTRGLACHAWEGYHAGDNVYLSRETIQWTRELVGTVNLTRAGSAAELRDEIGGLLFRALVGTSRLPLTSVEAPLPAFTFGQLGYLFRPDRQRSAQFPTQPMRSWRELIDHGLHTEQSWLGKAKALELLLRAVPTLELGDAARHFLARWQALGHSAQELPVLLRALFNEVSLSPYTHFVDHALAFVQQLVDGGALQVAEQVDFLGFLLRQLSRHLTAYDLVTFHHGGANYPDALLLDAVLQVYLNLAERYPELFRASRALSEAEERQQRLRRRALRQGWTLRRRYEDHPVPDAPTSPGENARVLPPPHVRVPDEQLTQPARRTRRLYAGDPLPSHLGEQARCVQRQSIDDLRHPLELQELGMAVFIERPLGVFKAVGEPDHTLLLAHEAFSKAIAEQRLDWLARDMETRIPAEEMDNFRQQLHALHVPGLPARELAPMARPVVSLSDARRVAEDFVILRTLPGGLAEFRQQFDLTPLATQGGEDLLHPGQQWLLVRVTTEPATPTGTLTVYDAALRKRLELEVNGEEGYATWAGREYPTAGLRVRSVWDASGEPTFCLDPSAGSAKLA